MRKTADWIFWGTATFALFWMLGSRGLWAAEGRWAEVAREMLLSGDYFHPNINGSPYFDKPLIGYWLVVLTAPLTGLNEWALRIPSALCGLAALWATYRLGADIWDARTGRLAAWILLTAQAFMFWARTGMADMANLAFIMLAVYWYWRRRARPCFATYLVFYLCLFIGAQMKGLTAVVVPLLVVTPDLLFTGRWRHLLSPTHVLALLLGALFYIVPFLYASLTATDYASCGIDLVIRENIQRYFDPFDHIEPFYAYFLHLPVLFLPWTPVLLLGIIAMARRRRWRDYPWPSRWIGLAMLLIFTFFTMSGSRRSYYILPILPFCALFCARWLLTLPEQAWAMTRRLQIGLLAIISAGLAAAGPAAFWYFSKFNMPIPASLIWSLTGCALLVLTAWLIFLPRHERLPRLLDLPKAPAALLALLALIPLGYFCFVQPLLNRYRTEKPFALAIKDTGRQAGQTAFFQHHLENMIFYMDMQPPHPVWQTSQQAYDYLAQDPANVIILRQEMLPVLLEDFPSDRQGAPALHEDWPPWQNPARQYRRRIAWHLPTPTR